MTVSEGGVSIVVCLADIMAGSVVVRVMKLRVMVPVESGISLRDDVVAYGRIVSSASTKIARKIIAKFVRC